MYQMKRMKTDVSSIGYMLKMMDYFNFDPPYQRESGVWGLKKRQLFIDSLINGFDVPKFYFRKVNGYQEVLDVDNLKKRKYIRYEIVDGKQRLQAVRDFCTDKFPLARDVNYYDDRELETSLAGKRASDIEKEFPEIDFKFKRYIFDIILLDDLDEDLIEGFFIRLNEGEPLNAQEKRNAVNCTIRDVVKKYGRIGGAECEFMERCIHNRARYKNEEIYAKFIAICKQYDEKNIISDTKKATLDKLYNDSFNNILTDERVGQLNHQVLDILDKLSGIFCEKDGLLSSIGNISVFFYSALTLPSLWCGDNVDGRAVRSLINRFEVRRREVVNNTDPEIDLSEAQRDEYSAFEAYNRRVQSSNDGSAIALRSEILNYWLQHNGSMEGWRLKNDAAATD